MVQIEGLNNCVKATNGYLHHMVLQNDGTIWTWGENVYGVFGNGEDGDGKWTYDAVQVKGLNLFE